MIRTLVCGLFSALLLPAAAGAAGPTGPAALPTLPQMPIAPYPLVPTTIPDMNMPWAVGPAIPQGQFMRHIWIPPQNFVVDRYLPVPAQPDAVAAATAESDGNDASQRTTEKTDFQVLRQTFTAPGYYVTETTVGYQYPQRWMLEQPAPGLYQWRLLPAQFRPR